MAAQPMLYRAFRSNNVASYLCYEPGPWYGCRGLPAPCSMSVLDCEIKGVQPQSWYKVYGDYVCVYLISQHTYLSVRSATTSACTACGETSTMPP
eukprot:157672-Rhodomonas_salina.1